MAFRHTAESLAYALPPLLLTADRVARTVAAGIHGRRRSGPGDAFWQFREYEPGDPVADIDWRQTASSDRVHIREREWEAAQSVHLWADSRAGMRWRSGASLPTKAERAQLITLSLGALLLRGGERVGLLGHMPPVLGRAALGRLSHALETAKDGPPEGRVAARATIVLASDFLAPLDDIHRSVSLLAASGGNGHLLQILDPAEEEFPYSGRVRFESVAREAHFLAGRAETLRDAFRTRLAQHRGGLGEIARAFGWTLGHHRTDHRPEAALLALYELLSAGGSDARRNGSASRRAGAGA